MKHYNIQIAGKVQGVWFRKTMFETAMKMGVKGFVKNETDGGVYMEVEAPEEALNDFLVKCNEGSPKSNVTNMYVEEGPVQQFETFEISE